jgi:hypothetical protein
MTSLSRTIRTSISFFNVAVLDRHADKRVTGSWWWIVRWMAILSFPANRGCGRRSRSSSGLDEPGSRARWQALRRVHHAGSGEQRERIGSHPDARKLLRQNFGRAFPGANEPRSRRWRSTGSRLWRNETRRQAWPLQDRRAPQARAGWARFTKPATPASAAMSPSKSRTENSTIVPNAKRGP